MSISSRHNRNRVDIMSTSCRYHVDMMSISCRHHANIMSILCRHNVDMMSVDPACVIDTGDLPHHAIALVLPPPVIGRNLPVQYVVLGNKGHNTNTTKNIHRSAELLYISILMQNHVRHISHKTDCFPYVNLLCVQYTVLHYYHYYYY